VFNSLLEELTFGPVRSSPVRVLTKAGKLRPAKGWKKEYLRRHTESNDHARFPPQATVISRTACAVFETPRLLASERETIGLLFNIHFLTTNGLFMNKGAPLHSLVDFPFSFQERQEDLL